MKMETKRQKFERLANARTNKILDMIDLLGNLSNKLNYEYTKSDVEKIFNAIESDLKDAKKRFDAGDATKKEKFSL